ncbi:hypothetical protein HXY33_00640 [Candidatus Bathyarchaeota archaeon]|nr:hypothetical protein [Candidatus Bathyarchaeota archaeon]
MPQNNFSKLLLDAVEESLSSLGDSPKQAILFHLESSFNIKKEHIPENITEFTKALEKIFGPGANYLEKLIIKRLYEKLGFEAEDAGNLDFLESVNEVRKRLPRREEYITI